MRIQHYCYAIICLAAFVMLGCKQDKISSYKVARIETRDDQLGYSTPEGWKKRGPDPKGIYMVAFQVTEGDDVAEITVSPFPGDAGGVLRNVNRWRTRDLKLNPIDADQLANDARFITVAKTRQLYVDLSEPEAAGPKRKRVLGVMAIRDDMTWVFKMIGPADYVGKKKADFEKFVESVSFDGSTRN